MSIKVFCDGLCNIKKRVGCYAFYVEIDNKIMYTKTGVVTHEMVTNNVCEYTAVLEAVKHCIEKKYDNVTFFADSNLVIQQLKGVYKTFDGKMTMFKNEISSLIKNRSFAFEWISRNENDLADKLCKGFYIRNMKRGKVDLNV